MLEFHPNRSETTLNRREFARLLLGAGLCLPAISLLSGCSDQRRNIVFPESDWLLESPEDHGYSSEKLQACMDWLIESLKKEDQDATEVTVVKDGHMIMHAVHNEDVTRAEPVMSIGKSLYTGMLGIALAEKAIGSLDDPVLDYFPKLQEARGIHAIRLEEQLEFRDKDRAITFRHLASQTYGSFSPNRQPGEHWRYGSLGMTVLMHAVATALGYYDPDDPELNGGSGQLIEERIRNPIGADWGWTYHSWKTHENSLIEVTGNFLLFIMTNLDRARLGTFWLAKGRWKDQQIIPEAWHRECTRVPDVVKQATRREENHIYGYGFWTNSEGRLWSKLPTDSYLSAGHVSQKIWVCPSEGLVVAMRCDRDHGRFVDNVRDGEFFEKILASQVT
ncbi:MAG: serine hydrolase domain-containing protein [Verrucomicrobiales bacterium]